jgi:hypothetical protein
MRLPAVAIAAAFGCGIALGLHPAVASHVTSVLFLSFRFVGGSCSFLRGLPWQESNASSLPPLLHS